MFIDQATIHIKSGNGGNGCVSLHREKYRPKGGPDGGDGGGGGRIILKADPGMKTLLDFHWKQHFKAESGRHGQGSNKNGRHGADIVLRAPLGTVVKDEEDGHMIGELIRQDDVLVIAGGGLGGRGNAALVSVARKLPLFAERGEPGEEKTVTLELKLLADVGLVGYPNVGKSTLISRVSAARPKIADYPFTTLAPNLGVVRLPDDRSFVIADIPGLIEGAHTGKGLGDRFLRHIERTAVLLHLIDLSATERDDPLADYDRIRHELENYGVGLAERAEIVVGTKIDLPSSEANVGRARDRFEREGKPFYTISSVTGAGVDELMYAVAGLVDEARLAAVPEERSQVRVYTPSETEGIRVERESKHTWKVLNSKIERWVRMTDWGNDEAVDYLRERLTKAGLDDKLAEVGAAAGDEVIIADAAFEFQPDEPRVPGSGRNRTNGTGG